VSWYCGWNFQLLGIDASLHLGRECGSKWSVARPSAGKGAKGVMGPFARTEGLSRGEGCVKIRRVVALGQPKESVRKIQN